MQPRRRKAVFAAIAFCVLLLGAAVAVPMRAEAAWQTMQTEVETLRLQFATSTARRPVLWGDPSTGNAHDHYRRATAAANALQADHREELIATLLDTDEQVATRRVTLRERWQPVLAALRAGAAAEDAAAPLPGDDGTEPRVANLLDCRWAANAAVFEARALRHEGRGLEAVQRTLDAASLGADLTRTGPMINQMIGVAILAIATSEAWPEPALAKLDREALDLLAHGLARLDASLPPALDDRAERLFMAWHLQHAAPDAEWLPSSASAWRFGFSTRWMLADAFLTHAAMMQRLAVSARAPWPERAAAWDTECTAARGSGNPLVATSIPNLGAVEFSWREQIAKLRLLRLSVDLHRGVESPPLRDPIGGGAIAVTTTAAGTTLTCEAIPDRKPTSRRVTR